MAINEEGFGTDTLTITDVLLIGTQGTVQRLLQDEQTGQIYPVNNVFVSIINNAMVEEDKENIQSRSHFSIRSEESCGKTMSAS